MSKLKQRKRENKTYQKICWLKKLKKKKKNELPFSAKRKFNYNDSDYNKLNQTLCPQVKKKHLNK